MLCQREKFMPIFNESYEDVEKTRQETQYDVVPHQETQTISYDVLYLKKGNFISQIFHGAKGCSRQETGKH